MLQISVAVNTRILWTVTAHNDGTGTDEIGNYDVEVYEVDRGACGRPKPKLVSAGRLEGFERERGALELDRLVLMGP